MYGFYTKRIVTIQQVRTGKIIDHYQPRILGVACLGNMYDKISINEYNKACYSRWVGIIKRCYDINNATFNYCGGKGITVCLRWLCFEYFYNDLPTLQNYNLWVNDMNSYQLDKDTLQQNIPIENRVFSPQTCLFIPSTNNNYTNNKSGYTGVTYDEKSNTYRVQANCLGKHIRCGSYDDPIAAANEYNYIARAQGYSEELLNNVPYMEHIDILKHKIIREAKDPKKSKTMKLVIRQIRK